MYSTTKIAEGGGKKKEMSMISRVYTKTGF
jgi:hypothetical protein